MTTRTIAVVPPGPLTLRFLYGVAIAFAAFVAWLYFRSSESLPPEKAHEQFVGMLGMIVLDALLVAVIVWAVNRRSIELTATSLSIRAGFYSRTLPRSALRIESAVVESLFDNRELAPRWRTNAIRIPGFRAGWFRLVNREKAFALITDPRVVTYLPTTAGYVLLLSTTELLPALQDSGDANSPS
jgi:hypothetical protein